MMKRQLIGRSMLDNHIGCFGRFQLEDPICKSLCALSLRCSTERERSNRLELLEELVSPDTMFTKTQ